MRPWILLRFASAALSRLTPAGESSATESARRV